MRILEIDKINGTMLIEWENGTILNHHLPPYEVQHDEQLLSAYLEEQRPPEAEVSPLLESMVKPHENETAIPVDDGNDTGKEATVKVELKWII